MIKSEIGKRRYQTRLKPRSGWPELTALIDVMFLTLLFLFLSASFVRVSGVKVELPKVRVSSAVSLERFIVTVVPPASAGQPHLFYFNDQPVSLETLKQRLAEVSGRSGNASIIIRADRRVPFEQVAQVMALAEAAKLSSFIAVVPASASQETVFGQ